MSRNQERLNFRSQLNVGFNSEFSKTSDAGEFGSSMFLYGIAADNQIINITPYAVFSFIRLAILSTLIWSVSELFKNPLSGSFPHSFIQCFWFSVAYLVFGVIQIAKSIYDAACNDDSLISDFRWKRQKSKAFVVYLIFVFLKALFFYFSALLLDSTSMAYSKHITGAVNGELFFFAFDQHFPVYDSPAHFNCSLYVFGILAVLAFLIWIVDIFFMAGVGKHFI